MSDEPRSLLSLEDPLETILARLDDHFSDPRYDNPLDTVGELDPTLAGEILRAKVDRCAAYVKRCQQYAAWLSQQAAALEEKANKAERRAKAHLAYVEYAMKKHEYEKLGGNASCFVRVRASTPQVIPDRQPTIDDVFETGHLVRVISTRYEWDKVAIKKAIDAGAEFKFIKLEYSEKIVIGDNALPASKPKRKSRNGKATASDQASLASSESSGLAEIAALPDRSGIAASHVAGSDGAHSDDGAIKES